jgi:hypothetical protein
MGKIHRSVQRVHHPPVSGRRRVQARLFHQKPVIGKRPAQHGKNFFLRRPVHIGHNVHKPLVVDVKGPSGAPAMDGAGLGQRPPKRPQQRIVTWIRFHRKTSGEKIKNNV